MGEAMKKWSATYTKHVKQKRKVYQDGVLELHPSRNKVILYDDCETPLESRFVKKDDDFEPGQTLAFPSYLVDIGELFGCGDDKKSVPNFSQFQKGTCVNRKREAFHTPKASNDTAQERYPKLGQTKARPINISPSRKFIREYKKNEMTKYGSSPGCPETTKSSKEEWQVLYTTHITQKAKKYHDGLLELHSCGSQRKQIMLYDETTRLLATRFLKLDEIIKSGDATQFEGYLVDIGEMKEGSKAPVDLKIEEKVHHVVGKTQGARRQLHPNTLFTAAPVPSPGIIGKCQKEVPLKNITSNFKSSIGETNTCSPGASKVLVRPAHEILSILRKKSQMDVATPESSSTAEQHAPQSLSFLQKEENLLDAQYDGRKMMDLDEEKARKAKCSGISKYEDVERAIFDEITDSDKTEFTTASSFFVGIFEDRPGSGPRSFSTLEQDLKSENAAVLKDGTREYLECGNHAVSVSQRENTTETASGAVSGSDVHQFSVKVEPQSASQPCEASKQTHRRWMNGNRVIAAATYGNSDSQAISERDTETKKTYDFPSFDLGI